MRIGGVDIRDIPKERLMDTVSFVFQNSRLTRRLFWIMCAWAGPRPRGKRCWRTEMRPVYGYYRKAAKGMDTVIGTKGVYLSGGEQQRIAIARVMLKNTPIVILDEATAFADPDNEARVQAAFSNLSRGRTVIMIAHRLSTIANVDRIYVVKDGQVIEDGSYPELMAQEGVFHRMWDNYQTSVQWKVSREVG